MPDCKTCKEGRVEPVPYIVHEAEMARQERSNKRWFIAWLITFILLVGCVAGFIWYESQWETVETWQDVWQEAAGDGSNNFVGGDYYGWAESENQDADANP